MAFTYVLSWLLNVLVWGVVLAIIDEGKGYGLEKMPMVPFLLAIGIPTLLEVLAYTFEQKPFLALIWPGFAALL
ncbi:MAG: hypothetical protein KAW41_01995 [Candidatus Diapherotrites archaeon]|nr:hypothetical protein [Candidatus Diapherotrites archaeon]